MRMRILFSALVFTLFTVLAGSAMAQEAEVVYGEKAEGSRGSKYELPTSDEAEPKMDGARAMCCLDFDNWTGYYIDVWVDGSYRGRLEPWDLDGLCVAPGWTSWHAESAGGSYSWSGSGDCNGNYSLRLE